ncbi:MAG: hypothetical protein E6Q36_00200 [Chryseobacterium sp.]|nr:MAG: hypothetical protein E6Q36_00200 [Chryseobacterium sp.]
MDGRTHNWVNLGVTVGVCVGAGFAQYAPLSDIATIAGWSLIGLLIGPDLDQDGGNISYYYMKKVGLRRFWAWYWRPYALSMKHRSIWSHGPFIGTFIRLLYIVFPIFWVRHHKRVLLAQILGLSLLVLGLQLFTFWGIIYFYVGLCIPDIAHFLVDILT